VFRSSTSYESHVSSPLTRVRHFFTYSLPKLASSANSCFYARRCSICVMADACFCSSSAITSDQPVGVFSTVWIRYSFQEALPRCGTMAACYLQSYPEE
jgi:hypothetical protein